MEEWKEYKLGDIYEVHNGLSKGGKFFGSGFPFLSFSTIFKNWFIPNELTNLVQSTEKEQESYSIKKGDIFVTRTSETADELGMSCVALKDYPKATYNGFCKRMRQYNQNVEIDPRFIGYYLRNPTFRLIFQAFAGSMSTRASLTNEALLGLPLKLPPLPTQQKIAAILSSLDDKIELNNKINENLEQQAQALFKSWFIDLEPFGGKMPEEWKEGTVGDLCSTISKTYKGNDSNVVLINTSDVENGSILNHDTVPNSNLKGQFKKTFQKGDILYSEIRPANKHYAFVDIEETSNYIASTKLMVIRPNEGINSHYLYHILTNPELIQEMQHLAETRSGTFPQITFESELSTYPIPLLPKEEQDKLGELFEKIDNQIFHNIKENKQLSTIRDTLLPKLMNGEVEV